MPAADVKDKPTLPSDLQRVRLLVEKAVLGDPESFGELYDLYADRIYRHCYYRTRNEVEAEDLTARVFLNAYQAIGNYKDMGRPFVVWLKSIAHNLLVDYYRAKRDDVYIADRPGDGEVRLVADPESDPEHFVERSFENANLRHAIGSLRRDWQIVVVCRLVEGMEYSEIAPILGKSEGATRVLLHRALDRLRGILVEETPLEVLKNGNGPGEIERQVTNDFRRRINGYVRSHQKKTWMLMDVASATGRRRLSVFMLPYQMVSLIKPYKVGEGKWDRFELPLDVFIRVCEKLGPVTRRSKRFREED